jgi:hypothetical protein
MKKRKEKFADFLLDLAKIILASLVLGAVLGNDSFDQIKLLWLGIVIFVLLTVLGFLFQPKKQ